MQDRMAEMTAEKQHLADKSKKAKKLKEKRERYEKMKQELEEMEKEVLAQCKENDKQLRGLPETIRKKRARDNAEAPSEIENDVESDETETPKPSKIPKKIHDYPDKFQPTGNVRIDFVEGWNLPSQTSGVQMRMPQSFRDRILRNEFFSYCELHKAMTKKDVVSVQRAQKLMSWLEGQGTDPSPSTSTSPVPDDSIRLLDLVMMQTNFFTLYSQMHPKYALTHHEHEYTLYEMIKQGYGMARTIEFDDMARSHYMAKLGEPWIVDNFAFQRQLTSAQQSPLVKREAKNVQKQKQNPPPSYRPKGSGGHSFGKSKPRHNNSNNPEGLCYAFNGMSKNLADCPHGSSCKYKHKCFTCKGPHSKNDCDKTKGV